MNRDWPAPLAGHVSVLLRGADGTEVEVGPFDPGSGLDREHLAECVDEALVAAAMSEPNYHEVPRHASERAREHRYQGDESACMFSK